MLFTDINNKENMNIAHIPRPNGISEIWNDFISNANFIPFHQSKHQTTRLSSSKEHYVIIKLFCVSTKNYFKNVWQTARGLANSPQADRE